MYRKENALLIIPLAE